MHNNANLMKKRVLLEDIQGNEIYPRPALPIGFIIFLNNALDPNTYFIGTWEKIEEETFFMTASSSYPVGQISGSNEVTLDTENIPPHRHQCSGAGNTALKNGSYTLMSDVNGQNPRPDFYTGYTGEGQPFDIKPKRYTVNAWVRVS